MEKSRAIVTRDQLCSLIMDLGSDRLTDSQKGWALGIKSHYVDMMRSILGLTDVKAPRRDKGMVEKAIEIFQDNPDKSAYQLFLEYGKDIGLADYQSYYTILRENGIETNRKRDFWSPIKDRKLLYMRDKEHRSFGEITRILGARSANATNQHYKYLKGIRSKSRVDQMARAEARRAQETMKKMYKEKNKECDK